MQVFAAIRTHYRLIGPNHAGIRLEEEHRLRWNNRPLLNGMVSVVAPNCHDLAAGNDRSQQPDIGEVVPGSRVVDGHPCQRVPRYRCDGLGVLPAVDLQLDDAIGRILAGSGETGYTHAASLAIGMGFHDM